MSHTYKIYQVSSVRLKSKLPPVVFSMLGGIIGDSVELPKWFNSRSGTKKSAKSIFLWLVEGSLSIGCNLGSECLEC